MKIELGDMKVIIDSGLSSDGRGCITFQKSFKSFDINKEAPCDIPITIYFKNIASIDTVIRSLEHIKEVMKDEK